MFKVNNKDTKTTPLASFWYLSYWLWTYFTPCYSVAIVNFEDVIAGWDSITYYVRHYRWITKGWTPPQIDLLGTTEQLVLKLKMSHNILLLLFIKHKNLPYLVTAHRLPYRGYKIAYNAYDRRLKFAWWISNIKDEYSLVHAFSFLSFLTIWVFFVTGTSELWVNSLTSTK